MAAVPGRGSGPPFQAGYEPCALFLAAPEALFLVPFFAAFFAAFRPLPLAAPADDRDDDADPEACVAASRSSAMPAWMPDVTTRTSST